LEACSNKFLGALAGLSLTLKFSKTVQMLLLQHALFYNSRVPVELLADQASRFYRNYRACRCLDSPYSTLFFSAVPLLLWRIRHSHCFLLLYPLCYDNFEFVSSSRSVRFPISSSALSSGWSSAGLKQLLILSLLLSLKRPLR
jgi:hypothetical protein